MHVDSDRPTGPSIAPVASAPWQLRIPVLRLAIVASGLLAAGQAAAQEAAQEAAEPTSPQTTLPAAGQASLPAKAAKPARNGKVCQIEDVTGSRLKKRICYTQEQWEARERAAKDLARELDGKPIAKDGNGG